jgi:small neutral amino acid transporter SnatA (MarC family)
VSDFLRIAATMFVAISPAAVAVAVERPGSRLMARTMVIAAVAAMAVYAGAGLGASSLLDAIDIEPETFRVSAGLVMAVGGVFAIWSGTAGYGGELDSRWSALFPLALPILVSPAGLAAVLSHSADGDTGLAMGAAAVAVALAALAVVARLGRFRAAADGIARVSGALLIAFAGALIVDGVRAV